MIAGYVLLLTVLLILIVAAIRMDQRVHRRETLRAVIDRAAASTDLPPDAVRYLSALDDSLGLPSDLRAEIRAELTNHLDDSIAAIEAVGLDRRLHAHVAQFADVLAGD